MNITELFYTLVLAVGLLVLVLIVIEIFLYYKSWSIVHRIKGKIKISEDKREYMADSLLAVISLLMTVIINAIILLVLLLCFMVILYSVFYLTEYFFVVFAAVLAVLMTLIYLSIRLIRNYNEQKYR